MQKIVPHLWYDKEAVEAANFYVSVFGEKGKALIKSTTTIHDTPSGSADIVVFELLGQDFMAISAGPPPAGGFKFTEAISFVVSCDSQEEIDYYWGKLSAVPEAEQCGWLKDKYGLSWQIVPTAMQQMMTTGTPEQVARVTQAFLKMKKFGIAKLKEAYEGE